MTKKRQHVKKEGILEDTKAISLATQVWNKKAAIVMKLKSILQQMDLLLSSFVPKIIER